MKFEKGSSRCVLLIGQLAIKFPRFKRWSLFLSGLQANLQEREWGRVHCDGFCPVHFADPIGLTVWMPRATMLTEAEFESFNVDEFLNREDYVIPAEAKYTSFGWLNGKIVAIDYGS